ncbi:hypothetical protein [Bacillus cereus]|uniref:hypothetical protein n=1 Tax=Bacillus cereus TaxID=1396 RepID=UPI0015D47885|nr:hypothetical protein [Bacillus cereus]
MIKQTCFSLQMSKDGYLAIKDNYKNNWTSSFEKADEFRIDLIIIDKIDRLKFPTLYTTTSHYFRKILSYLYQTAANDKI